MESTCLNLEGRIESFPDIQFEDLVTEAKGVFWSKRPEVYWRLTYRSKVDKVTLDDTVFLNLTGPRPTTASREKKLKFNYLDKPKAFKGRNALGRLIKFIKNFDYGIPS